MIGATIADAGTGAGTTTNGYGFYSIRLDEGIHRLVFSFVGFRTDTMDLRLEKDIHSKCST